MWAYFNCNFSLIRIVRMQHADSANNQQNKSNKWLHITGRNQSHMNKFHKHALFFITLFADH